MEEEEESDDDEDVVFAKAREFLKIVRSTACVLEKQDSTSPVVGQVKDERRGKPIAQFGVHKVKRLKTVKSSERAITPSQRKKLERVKTPVTLFRKPPTLNVSAEEETEESVKRMLEHIRRMPQQEAYTPPPLPMVFIDNQNADEDISVTSETSLQSGAGVEFSYLTSEQDLTTWKLLRSSPRNCNVFVGNLGYKIDENLLLAAFQPFVVEQQQHNMKVRIVTDSLSGGSKGYGFVRFPYRRAAELAMICMQGFEIFGHEMQLGWGQEKVDDVLLPTTAMTKDAIAGKKVGMVISDSRCFREPVPGHGACKTSRKTRWDVQSYIEDSSEKLPQELSKKLDNDSGINELQETSVFNTDRTVSLEAESIETSPQTLSADELFQPDDNTYILERDKKMSLHSGLCTNKSAMSGDFSASQSRGISSLEQEATMWIGHSTVRKCPVTSCEVIENDKVFRSQCSTLRGKQDTVGRKPSHERPVEWLTRAQRAKMIETVCKNLREKGVKHHLGVFGTHYEADNSRLFVVCCKALTHEDLKLEFEKYGAVEININKDASGLSKGNAIVQYAKSASAETVLKKLHGKVLGSKPLVVKVAEPKRSTQ